MTSVTQKSRCLEFCYKTKQLSQDVCDTNEVPAWRCETNCFTFKATDAEQVGEFIQIVVSQYPNVAAEASEYYTRLFNAIITGNANDFCLKAQFNGVAGERNDGFALCTTLKNISTNKSICVCDEDISCKCKQKSGCK